MPRDYVEQRHIRIPTVPPVPSDLDITDLLIWEEEQRREQERRDHEYLHLPLHEYPPAREPDPQQRKDPERGVTIIQMYS